MTVREQTELIESQTLSPHAALSQNSAGRKRAEEPCTLRTAYQRDRDRIIHCKAFRRLKHKTQVFLSPEGDHYRTQLTHKLEVAQIARTIARALRLNEDLTEAISLGHDLGHTPFGHAGERALNDISPEGFFHYEQSVRVVEKLEKGGEGLNLTAEVRDGILCHTRGREASTLEGRVVRLADRVAYINHDIDDAIRAGVLREEDIPAKLLQTLGDRRSVRIDRLVHSIVEHSGEGRIGMDPEMEQAFEALHEFMFHSVYRNPYAKAEEQKVPLLVRRLYEYFKEQPRKMPPELQKIAQEESTDRAVCDYIAGMTDHFAIQIFQEIYIPKAWHISL